MAKTTAKYELQLWHKLHCTHEEPYHLWCDGDCWEYKGLSSRLTEAYMKQMTIRGLMFIPHPADVSDFIGYHTGIMSDHPEWREQLHKMGRFGREWKRFIKIYPTLVQLYSEKR